MAEFAETSEYITVNVGVRLHVRHFCPLRPGPVALLVHGSIENGRIFYGAQGGLARFLAAAGWDVYVPDLRGRGRSWPPAHRGQLAGQAETLLEDLPALLGWIAQRRPQAPQAWFSHSWGGLLLCALLARHPHLRPRALLHFGSKRRISVNHPEKWAKIDLFWFRLAPWLIRRYGFLPMRDLGFGGENEPALTHRDTVAWMRSERWRDADGFDYTAALGRLELPPMLFLAGAADRYLGHPHDVAAFRAEVGAPSDYWLLSRSEGMARDYGHLDMLTSAEAEREIFPRVLAWLADQGLGAE